ncbi:MFS transporter [Terracoccus luteus]|uniref:MFS family permease n=1 Tax=Terracoccus luteus TaxID=53356 RepID=A0A839Q0X9_9MICO|nr:MFS transporter [Terracoccus luteus]MBB2987925.1 MFS family permease [Terracoccus luteus]MCP2173576.1 MFS family permease [Terracoccus luteus]
MRTKILILASAIGMLGWGTVLPYQYAYAANTRGWGALAAALASTLFSVGALVAAPIGGRLADRFDPVVVAVTAKVVAAVGVGGLVLADSPAAFFTGMFVFGLGLTAATPAASVLVLRWVRAEDRRKVFAYKFTAEAVGMAVGAFVAGQLVDLSRPDGMTWAFVAAGVGFALSAGLIYVAGVGAPSLADSELGATAGQSAGDAVDRVGVLDGLRRIFAVPALRWTALVTVTLALGFYAQFESGLPAYALTVLDVRESTIGLAAAVNCLVIVALQVVVVRLTAKRSAPSLLMVVGGIWTLSWVVLSVAQLEPAIASALFVTTFGIFAVGETMYAPVLNPLTASLAPAGMVGTTLGTFTAIQTTFSALGPLVAGALLGAGLANGFLVMHVVISLTAVYGAWRLRGALRRHGGATTRPTPEQDGHMDAGSRRPDAPVVAPAAA